MAGFRNTSYKDEWQKYVGSSKTEYADGTYFEEGGKYAVFDGGHNLMGCVDKNGTFSTDGSALTEYKASFLRSAKAELVRQGLVSALSGDKL